MQKCKKSRLVPKEFEMGFPRFSLPSIPKISIPSGVADLASKVGKEALIKTATATGGPLAGMAARRLLETKFSTSSSDTSANLKESGKNEETGFFAKLIARLLGLKV